MIDTNSDIGSQMNSDIESRTAKLNGRVNTAKCNGRVHTRQPTGVEAGGIESGFGVHRVTVSTQTTGNSSARASATKTSWFARMLEGTYVMDDVTCKYCVDGRMLRSHFLMADHPLHNVMPRQVMNTYELGDRLMQTLAVIGLEEGDQLKICRSGLVLSKRKAGPCLRKYGYDNLAEAVLGGLKLIFMLVNDGGLMIPHVEPANEGMNLTQALAYVRTFGEPQAHIPFSGGTLNDIEEWADELNGVVRGDAPKAVYDASPDEMLIGALHRHTGVLAVPSVTGEVVLRQGTEDIDLHTHLAQRAAARHIARQLRPGATVLLINPTAYMAHRCEDLNLAVHVIMHRGGPSVERNEMPVDGLGNEGPVAEAVRCWNASRELLAVPAPHSIRECEPYEWAETISMTGMTASLVVTMETARFVRDYIMCDAWRVLRNNAACAAVQVVHVECMPPELAMLTEPGVTRVASGTHKTERIGGLGRHVDPLHLFNSSTVQCTMISKVSRGTMGVCGPAVPWLEKTSVITQDGITSGSSVRTRIARTGNYVSWLEMHDGTTARHNVMHQLHEDFEYVMVADVDLARLGHTRANSRLANLCMFPHCTAYDDTEYGAVPVSRRLLKLVYTTSIQPVENTRDSQGRALEVSKSDSQIKGQLTDMLRARLATLKIFDGTAQQYIDEMPAQHAAIFMKTAIEGIYHRVKGGTTEKFGPLAFMARAWVQVRCMWSTTYRNRVTQWLQSGARSAQNKGALQGTCGVGATHLAYNLPWNPVLNTSAPRALRCVAQTSWVNPIVKLVERVRGDALTREVAARVDAVAAHLGVVGGRWDCIYVALEKSGFKIEERFMKEQAMPLTEDAMRIVLDTVATIHQCQFSVYMSGVERIRAGSLGPVITWLMPNDSHVEHKKGTILAHMWSRRVDVTQDLAALEIFSFEPEVRHLLIQTLDVAAALREVGEARVTAEIGEWQPGDGKPSFAITEWRGAPIRVPTYGREAEELRAGGIAATITRALLTRRLLLGCRGTADVEQRPLEVVVEPMHPSDVGLDVEEEPPHLLGPTRDPRPPEVILWYLKRDGLRSRWYVDNSTPDDVKVEPGYSVHAPFGQQGAHWGNFDHRGIPGARALSTGMYQLRNTETLLEKYRLTIMDVINARTADAPDDPSKVQASPTEGESKGVSDEKGQQHRLGERAHGKRGLAAAATKAKDSRKKSGQRQPEQKPAAPTQKGGKSSGGAQNKSAPADTPVKYPGTPGVASSAPGRPKGEPKSRPQSGSSTSSSMSKQTRQPRSRSAAPPGGPTDAKADDAPGSGGWPGVLRKVEEDLLSNGFTYVCESKAAYPWPPLHEVFKKELRARSDEAKAKSMAPLIGATNKLALLDGRDPWRCHTLFLEGVPGCGKTTALAALKNSSLVLTHSRVAKERMKAEGFDAETIELIADAGRRIKGKVLFVDEALLIGAQRISSVLRVLKHTGPVVCTLGVLQVQTLAVRGIPQACVDMANREEYRCMKKTVSHTVPDKVRVVLNKRLFKQFPITATTSKSTGRIRVCTGTFDQAKRLGETKHTGVISVTNSGADVLECTTAHRAQGGRYDRVVIHLTGGRMPTQSHLGRNVFTHLGSAITRSRGDVIVVEAAGQTLGRSWLPGAAHVSIGTLLVSARKAKKKRDKQESASTMSKARTPENLKASRGPGLVLVGPAGAGKSSLIRALAEAGYSAVDLEDSHVKGHQRSVDEIPTGYDFVGGAEVKPRAHASYVWALVKPSRKMYDERRATRDKLQPAKAAQVDNYDRWKEGDSIYRVVIRDEQLEAAMDLLRAALDAARQRRLKGERRIGYTFAGMPARDDVGSRYRSELRKHAQITHFERGEVYHGAEDGSREKAYEFKREVYNADITVNDMGNVYSRTAEIAAGLAAYKEKGTPLPTGGRLDPDRMHEIGRVFGMLWPNTAEHDIRIKAGGVMRRSEIRESARATLGVDHPGRTEKPCRMVGPTHDILPVQDNDPFFALHTSMRRFVAKTAQSVFDDQARNQPAAWKVRKTQLASLYRDCAERAVGMFDGNKLAALKSLLADGMADNTAPFFKGQSLKQGGPDRVMEYTTSAMLDPRVATTIAKTQVKGQDFCKVDVPTKVKKARKAGQPVNAFATLFAWDMGAVFRVVEAILGCTRDQFAFTAMEGVSTQAARQRLDPYIDVEDEMVETDVSGMDSSHNNLWVEEFLTPFLNKLGRLAGADGLGDLVLTAYNNVQRKWSTREAPGATFTFRTLVAAILGSGLRDTLLKNGLRCLTDVLMHTEGLPKWAVFQGDDSLYGLDAKHRGQERNYGKLAEVTIKTQRRKGKGMFCNEIWTPSETQLATNLARLTLKFVSTPLPVERLAFNKRVGELREALRDLVPPTCEARARITAMNALIDDRISVAGYEYLYDTLVLLQRMSADAWFFNSRPVTLLGGLYVMEWIGDNA